MPFFDSIYISLSVPLSLPSIKITTREEMASVCAVPERRVVAATRCLSRGIYLVENAIVSQVHRRVYGGESNEDFPLDFKYTSNLD